MVVTVLDYNQNTLVKIENVPDYMTTEKVEAILFANYNEDEISYMISRDEVEEVTRDFRDLNRQTRLWK